tara:strand:- start:164 stop:406 length:243 start_codon:yes stop_codon:yes gene_type:complete
MIDKPKVMERMSSEGTEWNVRLANLRFVASLLPGSTHDAAARGTISRKNNLKIIEKSIDYDLRMSHNLVYKRKEIKCQKK